MLVECQQFRGRGTRVSPQTFVGGSIIGYQSKWNHLTNKRIELTKFILSRETQIPQVVN